MKGLIFQATFFSIIFCIGVLFGYFLHDIFSATALEPVCNIESVITELKEKETVYCKEFKIFKRKDKSLVIYKINATAKEKKR